VDGSAGGALVGWLVVVQAATAINRGSLTRSQAAIVSHAASADRAVIEVSEEGTEAAAATAVFMLLSGPRAFHVTPPFLFYIIDDATGAILFQGRIADPR
jgi:serine protease inhibitor